jgi:2-keto-4-pentenoate hydratase/2-oxohepta-3-ene-1,7-dioic acid hydratase in catechol pathway
MIRFVSFVKDGRPGWGVEVAGGVVDHAARTPQFPTLRSVIAAGALGRFGDGPADFGWDAAERAIPLPDPEKILCVGVNFPDRNEEYRDGQAAPAHPSLFVRFPRSFTAHGMPLIRPPESPQLDYEGEVAIVIGRAGRRIPERDAHAHIAGLTLANDGTIRDWVRHAKFNVTQGKNWDRSGSMGPWMIPFTDPAQLDGIRLTTTVNGETRQDDRTSRMLFPFHRIVAYVSTFTTLVPGDVILCGTPTGAGARRDPPVWLKPGDVVTVAAEGIGELVNGVADE